MNRPDQKNGAARMAYIGMDVHKDSIALARAPSGRAEPEYLGEIPNTPAAVAKLAKTLGAGGAPNRFCYEAGPCGYVLHRQLLELGHDCLVAAAPARLRVKTDRRDALELARLFRAGLLEPVWVPDAEHEAVRSLCRCRTDFKVHEHQQRQQLTGFVLLRGHHWPSGKSRWTQAHCRWLEALKFEQELDRRTCDEYLTAVRQATQRVADLDARLQELLPDWSLAPLVADLRALRGIDWLAAMLLAAELGDLRRFEAPQQLMSYLGMTPSENSSGARRRQGGITKAGNAHARRLLVEAAWCYRFPARITGHLERKARDASPQARDIAWKAQRRLCRKFRRLALKGKNPKAVCVAVGRELAGFVWDIARHSMNPAATA